MTDLGQQAALWTPGAPAPSADLFRSVAVDVKCLGAKPRRGGMWTSTYLGPDEVCGWAQWCRSEHFACGEQDLWLLTPDPEAPVYEVDTCADLAHLHHCYGRTDRYDQPGLDWTLVAERYAGVHLTDEGQWRTRLSNPYSLYGWDCESTLWLRWAFSDVTYARRVTIEEHDYADG